jgi:hypothetical protein
MRPAIIGITIMILAASFFSYKVATKERTLNKPKYDYRCVRTAKDLE